MPVVENARCRMIGANKFRLWLRHPGYNGGKDSPPPPDYTPMASASEKAAQLGYDLDRKSTRLNSSHT